MLLTAVGVYEPIVEWGGAGATVPLTGFGYFACERREEGRRGAGLARRDDRRALATAGGIAAAVCFAVVMALLFRPGDKR